MKRFIAICLSILACVAFVACTGDDYYEEFDPELSSLPHKITYTIDVEIKSTDPSAIRKSINEKSLSLGAYIQDHTENYRNGECEYITITYCVPTQNLEQLIDFVESSGEMESKRVYGENISAQLANTEAKIESLKNRMKSLETLLDKAVDSSERVQLISEISSVEAELRSLEAVLNDFNNSVEYSTLTISITQKTPASKIIIPIVVILLISASGVVTTIVSVRISRKRARARKENDN